MPDIIRLRTTFETTSAIGGLALRRRPFFPFVQRLHEIWFYCIGNELDNRHHHGIAELAVKLSVRYILQNKGFARTIETHQSRAFAGREPTWSVAGLFNQNFRTILVV